jgi:hypothetical protein
LAVFALTILPVSSCKTSQATVSRGSLQFGCRVRADQAILALLYAG